MSPLTPAAPRSGRRFAAAGVAALTAWSLMAASVAAAFTLDPRVLVRKAEHGAARLAGPTQSLPKTEVPAPVPDADRKRGLVVFQRSVLERIHAKSVATAGENPPALRLAAAWDEREPLQVGVQALRELHGVNVSVGALEDGQGHSIPASAFDVRIERFYSLRLSLKDNRRYGVVPKTLEPAVPLDVPAGTTRPFWITVHVPVATPGGLYRGTLTVREKDARLDLPIEVDVLPRRLDEAAMMLGPWSVSVLRNLASAKGAEADRQRERADLLFRDIREHGMTSMGLLSGEVARTGEDGHVTVPDLDAAMPLYRRHGFPKPLFYAPTNLLSTNKLRTSSNYRHFDPEVHDDLAEALTRDYTRKAAEAGIPGLVFAPIDEPNVADGIAAGDDPDARQEIAAQLLKTVKKAGGRTAMTCTPDSGRIGGKDLDYWLVAYKKYDPSVLATIRKAGAHAGLYANSTLMGNGTSFSRFFFGYWPWSQRLDAMMAWTYPSGPKRFPENNDASGEGPLNVVDGFLGSDGRPVPVIQWELAREGVDDQRYLVTLQRLADRLRKDGSAEARRTVAEVDAFLAQLRASISADAHAYTFEDPSTFEPVASSGWDAARFEATRRRSFELLKKLDKAAGK